MPTAPAAPDSESFPNPGLLIPTAATMGRAGNASTFNRASAALPVLRRGSAANGKLTLRPGSRTTTTAYGLDQVDREFNCASELAQGLRPELSDPDMFMPGLLCVDASVEDGEGRQSIVRATYKGLINGRLRSPSRQCTTDSESRDITLPAGFSGVAGGGTGSGDGVASVSAKTLTITAYVPTPVYTLRGARAKQPDSGDLGRYGIPPLEPKHPARYVFSQGVDNGDGTIVTVQLTFLPHPKGWQLEKRDWQPAGSYFELTEQWRLKYLYAGVTLA